MVNLVTSGAVAGGAESGYLGLTDRVGCCGASPGVAIRDCVQGS